MNRFNAISPDFNDLIRHQEELVEYYKRENPRLKLQGKITPFMADRRLACAELILTLLRKHKKDPQISLFDEVIRMKR